MVADLTSDPVTEYAQLVVDGGELVCLYHRQACERHLRDLEKAEFVWDLKAAMHAVKFMCLLKHYKGRQFAGKPFEPSPWQVFVIGCIFGWKTKEGKRRFKEAYIEIPRKNGKTFLGAGVALYGLFADREPGAEVYSIATQRDQASICFEAAKAILKRVPSLAARSKSFKTAIVFNDINSFKPLSRETKSLDGLNPHVTVGDEVHAWEDRAAYDQIDDAVGARDQPLFFLITTAGSNFEGICYDLRSHVINILDGDEGGTYKDDEYFGFICTIDKDDDWQDESAWRKANPNLGVSKNMEYMRRQAQKATQIKSKRNPFKNKQLNIWTESGEVWLDMDEWRACGKSVDPERLKGHKCYSGLDLSAVQDITADVAVFPPGPYDEWAIYPKLYIPKDRIQEKKEEDKVPYDVWVEEGWLIPTEGSAVDYDCIEAGVLETGELFDVSEIGFDPWNALALANALAKHDGIEEKLFQVRQTLAHLSAPSKLFEWLVVNKMIRHGNHPVLSWMARNTRIIKDGNENYRPDKKASRKRIDGIVGAIIALARAMVHEDNESVYESRGFISDD